MNEDEYNALAAARKYVWAAKRALIAAAVPDKLRQRKRAAIDADLAKIDLVLDRADGLARRDPGEAG